MMRCRSLAEMRLRRDEISNTALNHVLKGFRVPCSSEPCSSVPDVSSSDGRTRSIRKRCHRAPARRARCCARHRRACRPTAPRSIKRESPRQWRSALRTPAPSLENSAKVRPYPRLPWPVSGLDERTQLRRIDGDRYEHRSRVSYCSECPKCITASPQSVHPRFQD